MEAVSMHAFKDAGHLFRLAAVFAVVGLALVGVRALLVPKSFGEYGHYRGNALAEIAASRMTTAVYDFSVTKPHSTWQIHVESQQVMPAYRGTVWIDTNTARVMRIEMEAENMPSDFPIDMIQTAVDYD